MLITKLAVHRPVATSMAVFAVLLGGVIGMLSLPVDKLPVSRSSTLTIFVGIRGGMPPEDIENLVTVPIEQAVSTLAGLKEMVSVAKKDKTNVTLVFDGSQNVKRATLEVSERLARIKGKLPKEIEKPIVARYNENDHPIVILSATSSVKTPEMIRTMIERDLKPRLARVPGVANVDIAGGRQRKILVEFNKSKLEMHHLSILDLIRDLGLNNIALMSGSYETGRDAWGVQVTSQFNSLDEIRNLGVAVTKEGSRIRIKDIAVVRDYYLEPESYSRVNRQPSVSIYVQKENGANTISTAAGVRKVLDEYKKELPSDVGIGVSIDQSVAIRQAIGSIREALTIGAFLTMFVLWLFLRRVKHVGAIVVSIPVAVVGTFLIMLVQAFLAKKMTDVTPMTINLMSLLGVALAIGRMVDDSIVVFENIEFRYGEALKKGVADKLKILVDATKEMAVPVASSTVIMVVVFLPIVFISEDIRRLYSDVAFTFIAALCISLIMAVTVVPLLASVLLPDPGEPDRSQVQWEKWLETKGGRWIRKIPWNKLRPFFLAMNTFFGFLFAVGTIQLFSEFFGLKWTLTRHVFGVPFSTIFFTFAVLGPGLSALRLVLMRGVGRGGLYVLIRHLSAWSIRNRGWIMAGIAVSTAFSIFIYADRLPKEYIGDQERKEFVIFVELPSGTKLDVSDRVVSAVENEINSLPEVKNVVKTVSARVEGWSSKIYVTLTPEAQRARTVQDVIDALRPRLKSIGAEYEAFIYFSEPSQAKEILIDCFGKDYLTLREVAIAVAKRIQEVPGLRDVKLRYKPGRPEVRLKVDHARASVFGLTSKEIADSLHAQIRGLRATYFNTGKEQVETVGRLSEEDRRTLEKVRNLSLVSRVNKPTVVPILQVVDPETAITPSEVWRRDKERVIQVSANRERMALSTAVEKAKAALQGLDIPVGTYYEFGGDYERLIKGEREFLWAFVVMLLLVYMVLASFFESYTQPFIMLLSIPLATAGAIPTLWITRTPVNLGAYLGFLMLGGTVVSNAVILIDRLNQVRHHRSLLRSVLKVGEERARPIFMTSLTTNAAMIPLILSKGGSADIWIPLGVVVVSGVFISSILTLFAVPAAYVIHQNLMAKWDSLFRA